MLDGGAERPTRQIPRGDESTSFAGRPPSALVPSLIVGMPVFGTLLPCRVVAEHGYRRPGTRSGTEVWFRQPGVGAGQANALAEGGGLAQVASDLIPYYLLAAACLAAMGIIQPRRRN